MPRADNNGIELEYDTFGDPSDPALLLVMGITAQMTSWDDAFCRLLADRGRFVIRFDNRDCGLSTKLDGVLVDVGAVMGAAMTGQPIPPVPYTLSDMGGDAMAVLDELGIDKAHIVGASMGGMIVQTMAIDHPDRVLTLTSIMSTVGDPAYGSATPEAMVALLAPPPDERDLYINQSVDTGKIFSSPRYYDEVQARARATASFDRSFYPEGASRQLGAIVASGDRSAALASLSVPTLVIHGRADALITKSGGERTAELIAGANLVMLNDMGHDLPEPLWPFIVDVLISHTKHAIG